MNAIICRCGQAMPTEGPGPLHNLLAHWRLAHGGVPSARVIVAAPTGMGLQESVA